MNLSDLIDHAQNVEIPEGLSPAQRDSLCLCGDLLDDHHIPLNPAANAYCRKCRCHEYVALSEYRA